MPEPLPQPGRKHPERGIHLSPDQPTILFLTVCTKNRERWLAQDVVQTTLIEAWNSSDTWLVGEYLLMPDHLHLFCSPRDTSVGLLRWVSWWKRRLSCSHLPETGRWQRDFWDTRLRRGESYQNKWWYVRNNPVRAALVSRTEDWPYQGRIHALPW